nr:ORF1 [Torque teno felis virus]
MYRRRKRRFWRRGRYFKRRRGRWHGRGRRRLRRRAYPTRVTQFVPRRHRYVTVRGWEPLANLCMTDCASTEAKPYESLENPTTGQWHGTWGKHYFTLSNLLLRAAAYWNQWSDDWSGYDYVKYEGGWIYIPKDKQIEWLINFDPYIQYLEILGSKNNKEDRWGHPGILLNTPGTHLILPPTMYNRKHFYKIRLRPPPGWVGFQRFPEAMGYILVHWLWSWFSLQFAYHQPNYGQNISTCEQEPWWALNNNFNKWVDRITYQNCSSNLKDKNWGPFLPSTYGHNGPETSLTFFYKLKFKFSGNSIWRPLPRNYKNDGLVPTPPAAPGYHSGPETSRKRPQHEADIWPGDLDSDGILKDSAYRRITGHNPRVKRRKVSDHDTQRESNAVRDLERRVRHILDQFGVAG